MHMLNQALTSTIPPHPCQNPIETADATAVAASDGSGIISGWDVRRGALLAAAPAHDQAATDCQWSPKGDMLVSCGYDGHIGLLRVRLAWTRC